MTPEMKVRGLHGNGDPVEVLNGIISGIDVFESEYPLVQAQ